MAAKILIVDDEPNVLRMLGYALESEGLKVITAETAHEALALIAGEKPDLVVLDRMLPDKSVIEVCEELRSDPETTSLPVIMLTAKVQVADRIRGLNAGADDYVTKPFEPEEMTARVLGLLRRRAEISRHPMLAEESAPLGQIVAVYGAKGGVGQSVIAVNLAVAVKQVADKRVALVDASAWSGDVGLLLELDHPYSIHDLLPHADNDELDEAVFKTVLVTHASGISALLSKGEIDVSEGPVATSLRKILVALRELFDYVILDIAPFPSQCSLVGLGVADKTLLVTTSEVTAIRRVRPFVERIPELADAPTSILPILNRYDPQHQVPQKDIENALKLKFFATIPDETGLVMDSVNEGVPFLVSHPKSKISKRFCELAQAVVAPPDEEEETATTASRSSFWRGWRALPQISQ